jgi:tetratricopeptide (TPR) repeat protein
VLYIPSTAEPDYAKEGILLAKRPGSINGNCELPDRQGGAPARPQPAGSEADPGAVSAPGIAGLSPEAEQLLIGVSVYREPADGNAVVFQLGEHEWAANAADQRGPRPPYQPPEDLDEMLAACEDSGMLHSATCASDGSAESWQVDAWVAGELYHQLSAAGRQDAIVGAHRRAAEYWQWRAAAWPQDRRADLHDLLEARYHLVRAGDTEQGSELTHVVCAQLHAWGDLGREAELIQSTLEVLPARSVSRANWMHELGTIYQVRGEYGDAYRCYAGAVQMYAVLGDYRGVSRGQHSLGVLAQAEGDYRRAERHYKRSSAAERKAAGNAPPTADSEDEPAPLADAPVYKPATPALAPVASAPRAAAAPATRQPPARPAAPAPVPAPAADAQPAVSAPIPAAAGSPAAADPPLPARIPKPAADPAVSGRPTLRPAGRLFRRRSVLMPAAVALGLAGLTAVGLSTALARPAGQPAVRPESRPAVTTAGTVRAAAAAWVAQQVSQSAVVGCDPAECAALHQRGLPAGALLTFGPGGPADPLSADVIVVTAAVRAEFGARLAAVYAPAVLASFGSGTAGIQVRAIAADGTAAYLRAARADLTVRQRFGAELLANTHLIVSGPVRAALVAGRVDSRLLATLATLADIEPLRVLAFGDAGPGASPGVPLRSAEIAAPSAAAVGWTQTALRFLAEQQAPFLPSLTALAHPAGAGRALLVEYPSPSPLGLVGASGTSPGA